MIVCFYGGKYFSRWFKALHCYSCFSACRSVHFPVCEEDHRTCSALHLALLGCQGSCGIVPNGPASLYLGSSAYASAWSVSMQHWCQLKLWRNLNIFLTWSDVWNGREIANKVLLTLNMWNSTTVVYWYSVCSLYFAFEKDSKLTDLEYL